MAESNDNSIPSASSIQAQVLTFIERLYWALGAFCLYWFTRLEVVDYRMLPLDFPILGSCFPSEALILSLSFFWLPLLLLHLCVSGYQSRFAERRQWAGFPGVLGDLPIPRALAWMRVILFIVMVTLPTLAYVWSSGRALLRLDLQWSDDTTLKISGSQMFGQWGPPPGHAAPYGFLSPGWYWQSRDNEWRDKEVPGRSEGKEIRAVHTSGFPGLQPIFFVVMDGVMLGSLVRLWCRGLRAEKRILPAPVPERESLVP